MKFAPADGTGGEALKGPRTASAYDTGAGARPEAGAEAAGRGKESLPPAAKGKH